MPLDEEGAKWSCEPCIRGHRSSKCQHFDRLMMKVPKAGRPLAKCPHPKGACSCQKTYAFMVRIPKGSTCLCRPLYKVPADTNDSAQSTPSSVPPVSSPASGKVQKPGRRQSHIQAVPENIARALEATPDNLKLEEGIANHPTSFTPHQSGQNGSQQVINSNSGVPASLPNEPADSPPQAANGSSCCSKKSQPRPATPSDGESCCAGNSSAPQGPNTLSGANELKASQPATWHDISYVDFPANQLSSWQNPMASTGGQLMQSFGSSDTQAQPLYMNDYTPNVSATPYSNVMNGLGITQSAMAPFTSNHSQNHADPCHDCKCGDECQCLGCAAHPFNNTTRQHVQEMGVMMTFDGDEPTPETIANSYQSSPFPGSSATTPMNFFMQQSPSLDSHVQQNIFDPYSEPNSTMPSGYSSPLRASHPLNQQLMHPSEYYTLEYPVGIPAPCSDVTGSCQCGNDCSCVGCLTHSGHNGVPLQAPILEPSVANTTEQQVSSHGPPHTTSAGSHTSRIPVLENVSVPCLSPRTLETSMV